jgi:hypothetical protein
LPQKFESAIIERYDGARTSLKFERAQCEWRRASRRIIRERGGWGLNISGGVKRIASANDLIVVLVEDEEKNNSSAKEVGKVFCSAVLFRPIVSHLVYEVSRGSRERERERETDPCVRYVKRGRERREIRKSEERRARKGGGDDT